MSLPILALFKLFLSETLGSILRFPAWWYTNGLFETMRWCLRGLRYRWDSAALNVWLKNFFVPMYGQHDLAGRIVSVAMRFVVLIGRCIGLVVEAIGYALLIVLWVLLPIVSIIMFLESVFISGFRI